MIILRCIFILPFLLMIACSQSDCHLRTSELNQWRTNNGKIKVLSTIAMIDDVVKQIGGEYVDSLTLIKGELDPHSYQLVKGDDEKFAFADLVFYNGLGLEHGPSLQHHLHSNEKAIALGDQLDLSLLLRCNGQFDPHIWMDISLWAKIIPFIVDALSKHDPAHANTYQANGETLSKEMTEIHDEVLQQLQLIPPEKRYLVTSHDAFNYFTRAYLATVDETTMASWQKRFAAPEGLAPESQLSSADIRLIINHLQKHNIHVLFPESNVSKDSIRKIVQAGKEKGLDLTIATVYLYADAMGSPGSDGDTHLKMIQHNAKTIAEYLKVSK